MQIPPWFVRSFPRWILRLIEHSEFSLRFVILVELAAQAPQHWQHCRSHKKALKTSASYARARGEVGTPASLQNLQILCSTRNNHATVFESEYPPCVIEAVLTLLRWRHSRRFASQLFLKKYKIIHCVEYNIDVWKILRDCEMFQVKFTLRLGVISWSFDRTVSRFIHLPSKRQSTHVSGSSTHVPTQHAYES